jgi:hypothetical protein
MNSIKVNFNGVIKRFQVNDDFNKLKESLRKSYCANDFEVHYLDDENELFLIENDYDYSQALEYRKNQPNLALRFVLREKEEREKEELKAEHKKKDRREYREVPQILLRKPVLRPPVFYKPKNPRLANVLNYYIRYQYEKVLKKALLRWRSMLPDRRAYKLEQLLYRHRRHRVLKNALHKLKTYKPKQHRDRRFLHLFVRLRQFTLIRRVLNKWRNAKKALPKADLFKKIVLANKIFALRRKYKIKQALDKWKNKCRDSKLKQFVQKRFKNLFRKVLNKWRRQPRANDRREDPRARRFLKLKARLCVKKYWQKWKYALLRDIINANKIQKFLKLIKLKNAFSKIKCLVPPRQIPNSEIFDRLMNKRYNEEHRNNKLRYLLNKHRLNRPKNVKEAFNKLKQHKERENLRERFERLRVRDKVKLISSNNCLKEKFYRLKEFLTRRLALRKVMNKFKKLAQKGWNLAKMFQKCGRLARAHVFRQFKRKVYQEEDLKNYTNKLNSSWKASYDALKLKKAPLKPKFLNKVFALQYRLKNAFLKWKRLSRGNFLRRILLKIYVRKWMNKNNNRLRSHDHCRPDERYNQPYVSYRLVPKKCDNVQCLFRRLAFKLVMRKLKDYLRHKKLLRVREKFDSREQRMISEEQKRKLRLNKIKEEKMKKVSEDDNVVNRWRRLSQRFRAIVRVSKLLHRQVLLAH